MTPNLLQLTVSRQGVPCLWESGGSLTTTGESFLIGTNEARPKKSLFIQKKGNLSCSIHALIPVQRGDILIHCIHNDGKFTIYINTIIGIYLNSDDSYCETMTIYKYQDDAWDKQPADFLSIMINKAKTKALDYHCRAACYVAS